MRSGEMRRKSTHSHIVNAGLPYFTYLYRSIPYCLGYSSTRYFRISERSRKHRQIIPKRNPEKLSSFRRFPG